MRVFGHPVHTMLVHFPIAFWSLASICDGVALLGYQEAWRASTVLMGLSILVATVAMVPGLIDLAKLPDRAKKTGLIHMLYMGTAWMFYLLSLVFHIDQGAISTPNLLAISLGYAGFCCLAIGGFYGAELVYRHGAGQVSNKPS